MKSKYKKLVPKVLKKDVIMSTNQVRDALKELEGVKYIDFNLVYHLLTELKEEGKVEMLKDSKKYCFWKKK